jgi:Mrp family chromosome partitioning ATPase
LLITNRPDFADRVRGYAPEVDITITAPDNVSAETWSAAPAIFIDMHAAAALRARGLPPAPHSMIALITETAPVGEDWRNAVTLHAIRIAELPDAGPWLTAALHTAAHRPPVIAVTGPGADSTDTATTVALALAIDHLAHDQQVALITLRHNQTMATHQLTTKRSYAEFAPNRAGRLHLITHTHTPFQTGQLRTMLANLGSTYDVIIIDTPPPPCPEGSETLAHADLVLTVATPDQLTDPALAALTHPASEVADQVHLVILTADPDLIDHTALDRAGTTHLITPPGPDPTTWLANPDFRRDCSVGASLTTSSAPTHRPR